MRLASSCAIIQYRFSPSEGETSRMMIAPRGFSTEQTPAGWQIVQSAHKWYYGLRTIEKETPMADGGELACMLS